MPRLIKFALFGFLAYAVVTATPERQAEIGRGVLAVKDAAIEACTRENSLCARVADHAMKAVSGALTDAPAPYFDDDPKRKPASKPL
jgi:hypothetical protein